MAYIDEVDRVDGSWELNILVTDLQVERTLRVMGDLHIGGVMVRLVEALGNWNVVSAGMVALYIIQFWISTTTLMAGICGHFGGLFCHKSLQNFLQCKVINSFRMSVVCFATWPSLVVNCKFNHCDISNHKVRTALGSKKQNIQIPKFM